MSKLLLIFKRNAGTFYDYSTGKRRSTLPRLLCFLLLALAITMLFSTPQSDALGAVLTIQSILVGFSFSVLFFLLSAKPNAPVEGESIERSLKVERLATLGRELFYNVSYFNITAIFSLVVTLLFAFPSFDAESLKYLASESLKFDHWVNPGIAETMAYVCTSISSVLEFLFYFLLIESLYAFARTAVRVSFFFERLLEIESYPKRV